MLTNVFGISSNNPEIRNDTSLFVQEPYLRTNYIESSLNEDIDMEKHFKINNLPDPISMREPTS